MSRTALGVRWLCALVWLVAGAAGAWAAPAILPGTAATAGRCQAAIDAPCWDDAQVLTRFAADAEARLAPVQADVRLAWDAAGLWVRVGPLPPGRQVEIVVHKGTEPKERQAQVARFGPGVHALPLTPAPRSGQLRAMFLGLVQTGGGGVTGRWAWSPAGEGDLARPARLLLVDRITDAPGLRVAVDGGNLVLSAPSDGRPPRLEVAWVREQLPPWSRDVPAPWSAQADGELRAPMPAERGWFVVEATWRDDKERPVAHRRGLLWLPGSRGGDAFEAHGMHPAPVQLVPSAAGGFVLDPTARVVLAEPSWLAGAELLADELGRICGVKPAVQVGVGRAQETSGSEVLITDPPRRLLAADVDRAVLDDLSDAQSFSLAVSERGAVVRAARRIGATWGGLALADGLGEDCTLAALTATDRPGTPHRLLYHPIESRARGGIDVPEYQAFIRKAVTRGRYDQLVLLLTDGVKWASHPELASANAMTPDQVRLVVRTAAELGIEVIPASNSPGHANWLVKARPELSEDGSGAQICTRHTGGDAVLDDLYAELVALFTVDGVAPRWLHIGHDEVYWRTDESPEAARCPRCQGVPRHVLFAESIQARHAWLAARGMRAMVWSDMLLEDWNGARNGVYRALDDLPDAVRDDILFLGWSKLGDTVGTMEARGLDAGRVHTGYAEWKRRGLEADLDRAPDSLTTEGLAVFAAHPWTQFGYRSGTRMGRKSWPVVILAGVTGWRPELSTSPADALLARAASLPAYMPGRQAWSGRAAAVELTSGTDPALELLARAATPAGDGRPSAAAPRVANSAAAMAFDLPADAVAAGLLWTAVVGLDAEQRLGAEHARAETLRGAPVAEVVLTRSDGSAARRPVYYGLDVFRPDGDANAGLLWDAAGPVRFASPAAAAAHPDADDLHLVWWDTAVPQGQGQVRVQITVLEPGVSLYVYAAAAWAP